ncbi:MAG: hypothetical protein Q9168_006903 [Polycauliona sp. 1 TL-2023]
MIALSALSSLTIIARAALGSSIPKASLPVLNILVLGTAFTLNRNFWRAKAKVPFVGGFNQGIEKSKEIRQLLFVLGLAWSAMGLMGWIESCEYPWQ